MEEKAKKRRDWIKNVTIIFLIIMLLLTFFSNTIMNYSLPEVSAQYSTSGNISSKLRGSVTVEAAQPYEVKIEEKRTVEDVKIKAGDTVKKGQVLFILGDSDGSALDEAQEALDTANFEYQQKLLSEMPDYSAANLEIEFAKKDYEKALDAAKEAKKNDKEIRKLKTKIQAQQDEVDILTLEQEDCTAEVNSLKEEEPNVFAEQAVYDAAKEKLDAAQLDLTLTEKEKTRKEELIKLFEDSTVNTGIDYEQYTDAVVTLPETTKLYYQYQEDVNTYQKEANAAKAALDRATNAAKLQTRQELEEAEERLREATLEVKLETSDLTKLKSELEELQKDKITYEEAQKNVDTAKRAMEKLITDLKKTQGTDANAGDVKNLELTNMQKKITKLQKKVEKLRKSTETNKVKAKAAGIISVVNYVAGDTIEAEKPLAVIEMTDRGFVAKLSVTNEQSKQVHQGSVAEILNVWGAEVTATVESIKNDPDNLGKKKILNFTITGADVSVGQTLELSLGDKSAFYDTIVPNSAIHEDSKGKFILTVQVKSSPLGNRYIATRLDVEAVASDETSSAITGSTTGGEFVITTSTKPIEPGMQVRLVEGGDV